MFGEKDSGVGEDNKISYNAGISENHRIYWKVVGLEPGFGIEGEGGVAN